VPTGQFARISMMIRDMFPGNRATVKNEAAFLTRNQPVLFQPNSDYTWAW